MDKFISLYDTEYEWFITSIFSGEKPDSQKKHDDDDDYDEWQNEDGDIKRDIMDILKQEPEYRKMFIDDYYDEYKMFLLKQ